MLIDLTPMLLSDMLGLGMQLQRTYRQGYSLDARNSSVRQARTTPDRVVFEVTQHFATGSLAVPTPVRVVRQVRRSPSTPRAVPDPRSLFLTVHYTLSALPRQPMRRRQADARVGYFATTVTDFTDDLARTTAALHQPLAPEQEGPERRLVGAWCSPSCSGSTPASLRPMRATITAGVLAWNRAFEAIGYRNADRGAHAGAWSVHRHPGHGPGLHPLDDQCAAPLWRHRPLSRGPAHG